MGYDLEGRFQGRKVLITGGLGFIGSNLAIRLVEDGAEVTLVDSLIPTYGGNLFNIAGIKSRVRMNISDVRDQYSMNYLVRGQDYLFNLAGQTSHLDSMEDPFTDLEINCRAQLSILEACRRHNQELKVIFASTRQIYGRPEYLPVDENHPVRPVDINGVNKAAGESYHVLYNNIYDIRTTVLRLTNTYGPRMRVKDDRQTFLGNWIRLLLQGKPYSVWGGNQLRDLTFAADAVDALMLAAVMDDANGQVFNLAGYSSISLNELARLLVELNGGGRFEIRPFPPERERVDIGDYYADYSLVQKTLGWQPRITHPEGLAQTLDYYRKHLEHYL